MPTTVEDAKMTLRRFWHYLDTGNIAGMRDTIFAETYTYNGQPATAAGTAEAMEAGFKGLMYHRFYLLDVAGEQQGDIIKVVMRCMFIGARLKDAQKLRAMATNVVTISVETGEILTNWQTGAIKDTDFIKVDYHHCQLVNVWHMAGRGFEPRMS